MTSTFGNVSPDIVVSVRWEDKNVITEHPVEQGANITDHTYPLPVRCTIVCGWSLTGPKAAGDPNYLVNTTAMLLQMKNTKQLLQIVTSQRIQQNMFIENMVKEENAENYYSMLVTIDFKELILTSTRTTVLPPVPNQKYPQLTAPAAQLTWKNLQKPNNTNVLAPPK